MAQDKVAEDAKQSAISYAMAWGKSPLPPMLLATLTTALHFRPFQPLPMVFPPVFLLSTYLNLNGFPVDSAGITAAWSGLYILLARRRSYKGKGGIGARFSNKFGARGLTRGTAMGVAAANVIGGGVTYVFGKRKEETTVE